MPNPRKICQNVSKDYSRKWRPNRGQTYATERSRKWENAKRKPNKLGQNTNTLDQIHLEHRVWIPLALYETWCLVRWWGPEWRRKHQSSYIWKALKHVLQRGTLHCKHWKLVSTDLPFGVFLPTLLHWTQTFFLPSIWTEKCLLTLAAEKDKFSILRRFVAWPNEAVHEKPPISCLAKLILKFNCFTLPCPCPSR